MTLGLGTLTFTATGIVRLGFVPDPPTQNINLNADGIAIIGLNGEFKVCAIDENGDEVTDVDVEITSLVAIKNNGDTVLLDDLPEFPVSTVEGCVTFNGITLNKTGAYRLVVNGEFESLKFNVRPAKKER